MFYVIDELDNCLVLEVRRNNGQLLITDTSFEQIRSFYFINRGASVQFRYVGFGIFFISSWNHKNQPIQIRLDPDSYVPELMDPETLDNVSRVFHIKYTRIDEGPSPDVMVLSGSEPSDDEFSSYGDENNAEDGTLEGDNPHNPIDLCGASTLSMEVNEQISVFEISSYLKLSRDGSIWMITGPHSNVEKNVFFFHLLKSRGRDGEWKFRVGWNECCRVYNLKDGDNITLKLDSLPNRQIELSIQRC
ncbi:uncharacterized protein DS421_16g554370 [Arachis hypogaea]|nr:uncharacterized protein DS421_16g554370 [Arachis hypogaea]